MMIKNNIIMNKNLILKRYFYHLSYSHLLNLPRRGIVVVQPPSSRRENISSTSILLLSSSTSSRPKSETTTTTTTTNEYGTITATTTTTIPQTKESKSNQNNIDLTKYTKEIKVKIPELVENQTIKIVKWYKQPGDIIYPDDTICDIETELFTFGMDVDDECLGVMKEIILEEGRETNDSHTPLCIILHEDEKTGDDGETKNEIWTIMVKRIGIK